MLTQEEQYKLDRIRNHATKTPHDRLYILTWWIGERTKRALEVVPGLIVFPLAVVLSAVFDICTILFGRPGEVQLRVFIRAFEDWED